MGGWWWLGAVLGFIVISPIVSSMITGPFITKPLCKVLGFDPSQYTGTAFTRRFING